MSAQELFQNHTTAHHDGRVTWRGRPPKTALGRVFAVLLQASYEDRWMTAYEIQGEVMFLYDKLYSESGITARIRDLRKEKHGSHRIRSRPRKGRAVYEYRLGRSDS